MTFTASLLLDDEREQGDDAGALHGGRQRALVRGAVAGDAARQDLAALADVLAQARRVFVVERVEPLRAEVADLALRPAIFFRRRALAFGWWHRGVNLVVM